MSLRNTMRSVALMLALLTLGGCQRPSEADAPLTPSASAPSDSQTDGKVGATAHSEPTARPDGAPNAGTSTLCSWTAGETAAGELICLLKRAQNASMLTAVQLSVSWPDGLRLKGYRADVCVPPSGPCEARMVKANTRVGLSQHLVATKPQDITQASGALTLMLFKTQAPFTALPVDLGALIFERADVARPKQPDTPLDVHLTDAVGADAAARSIALRLDEGELKPGSASGP